MRGYFEGEDIAFIHPEASDPEVIEMLTHMMKSPVIVVPHLAEAGDAALAEDSMFTNVVEPDDHPMRPFGFQADVFDSVLGDEAHSPLRRIVRVTWQDGTAPRILRSVQEISEAEEAGEVTVERTEVVVNMPVLACPVGERYRFGAASTVA